MTDSFAVHIGGGAYLDAFGKIVFGPSTGVQLYDKPQGINLNTKKIQEALKDLAGLLPSSVEDEKKWEKWGVPLKVVTFLRSVSGAVGAAATFAALYFWVIGVVISILSLITKSEGLSPELENALNDVKSRLTGQEEIERATKMIELNAHLKGRVERMKSTLQDLSVHSISGDQRLEAFNKMQDLMDELAVPLSEILDQEWAFTYNKDNYDGRAFASYRLLFVRADGTLAPVPMHPSTVTVFDYRLGIPMLLYGATTMIALAQAAMPWFRSAGSYAGRLRSAADAIDRFVRRMQDESLARTEYTAQMVLEDQIWPMTDIVDPGSGGPAPYRSETLAVGAFDLIRYNDAFMVERFSEQFAAYQATGPRGLFNYHWRTTATNLQDIADAANEQAEQDYANLQVASGMLRLIHTSALLRFLSTPPTESQTVKGEVRDSRILHDEAPTTAKSPYIFPVGVIEYPATLKRYQARARARITTQEPGYYPPFHYRIFLRTIDSEFLNEGWSDRTYVGDVWKTEYVPTDGDPRVKRLKTELQTGLVLGQILLYEGPSPTDAVTIGDRATLPATTFDWYVPVASPWSYLASDSIKEAMTSGLGVAGAKKAMLGTGGVSVHLMGRNAVEQMPAKVMNYLSPLVTSVVDPILDLGGVAHLSEVTLEGAERRHVRTERVDFDWQLNWTADALEVRLFGSPETRPFQVHVVVEETVYSGETLPDEPGDILSDERLRAYIHTPFVAEMVTQLVFVDEAFFHNERTAFEEGRRMWREFLRRFTEEAPVGPGDPIEFLHQEIRDFVAHSQSTSTLAATVDKKVEFAMSQAPELWEAVLSDIRRKAAS
jgi:hypothetical protein